MVEVNAKFGKNTLMNIWDHNNMKYMRCYTHFVNPPKNKSAKQKSNISTIWKQYQTSELG